MNTLAIFVALVACFIGSVALWQVRVMVRTTEMRSMKVALLGTLYRETGPTAIRTWDPLADLALDELVQSGLASGTGGPRTARSLFAITDKGRRYLELGAL